MRRRSLLIGLGAAAGAGAVGTGAFTSVTADRDVEVSVADDSDALLGIEPGDGPNAQAFADAGGNKVALDFSKASGDVGLGTDSTYQFDDVLRLTNQGTQTVYAWVTLGFADSDLSREDLYFYPQSDESRRLNDGDNSVVTLPIGESVSLGLYVDTDGVEGGEQSLTATIHADVNAPSRSQPRDTSGEEAAVVTKDPDDGEFDSIQEAVNAVTGTTVFVESGTFGGDVDLNVSGLTLRGPNASVPGDADARGAEATVGGQLVVSASGVTVDGLKVSPPPASENPKGEALRVSDAAGDVTVKNTIVEGARAAESLDEDLGGIVAFGGQSGDPVSNVTIRDNLVTDVVGVKQKGSVGISVQGNVSTATVVGNTVTTIGDGETSYALGVAVRGSGNVSVVPRDVTITENTITGVRANDETRYVGVGIENEASASEISATRNNVSDVDVFAENKDTDTSLDATENWWGDAAGPESAKLLGARAPVDRGPIAVSPFLDAPFDEGGQPVYGGRFVAPGANPLDLTGDGSLEVSVLEAGEDPPAKADVHVTSEGVSTGDYGTSAVRLAEPPTLGDVADGTLEYDYYEGAANDQAAPDEVWLLLREADGTTHVVYRTANDGTSGRGPWKTRDVDAEVAGDPERRPGVNWIEITETGTDNLGDGDQTSDLTSVYGDDTEVLVVAAGRGNTNGGVADVYYRDLTVNGESIEFPGN